MLFDFGGTLDAPGRPWKDRIFRLYGEEGVDVHAERFDPVFYRVDDGMVGTIPGTLPFVDTVRQLVAGVNAGLAIDSAGLPERLARRFVDDATATLHAHTPLLSRLAERYRLGIVSNFYGNLATVCDETGIGPFFRVVVDSACVGSMKPDPRIFRHALEALGVQAPDATFVGDSLSRDMAGALAVAMPHIWLMGETVSPSRPCCPHDPVIRSLEELQGLLL